LRLVQTSCEARKLRHTLWKIEKKKKKKIKEKENQSTIIKLGYRKISWFASGEQMNYLPKAKAEANN